MIKPGIKQRKLPGRIIQRFEEKGLDLKAIKLFVPTKDLAADLTHLYMLR